MTTMAGETNNGGKFGPMDRYRVQAEKLRNSVMAKCSGNIVEFTESYIRCRRMINKNSGGFSKQAKIDFDAVFRLAAIGRYHLLLQLKETKDLLIDAGLAKPGDDLWGEKEC